MVLLETVNTEGRLVGASSTVEVRPMLFAALACLAFCAVPQEMP
jgi:hypothetical protein